LELIVFGQASGGSPDTPERLVVHPASGVVLVRADILTLNRVADFLEKISGSVHRQVQIDVRIIEVTLKDGHEVGIDWSRLPIASNSLASLDDDVAVAQHLSPNHEVFQIAASMGEFDALLDALETQGRIKVVSAPTVATLN
jgi:type II secretory pathway component GspD/PulD (secretin)